MNRKDPINAYKERKPKAGIFAVRCAPTGDVWIGESRNLDAQQNSVWFTLRNGSDKAMKVTASVELSPKVAQGRDLTVEIPAGGAVPIVIRTHGTRERDLRRALDRVAKMPSVSGKPVAIRIEENPG